MDTSNFTNVTSLQGLANFVNSQTDNILFTGAMIIFFIILLMQFINRNQLPFENNLAVASWIMFLVSSFFWFAHLVFTPVPILFLTIAAFSTLFLYSSR